MRWGWKSLCGRVLWANRKLLRTVLLSLRLWLSSRKLGLETKHSASFGNSYSSCLLDGRGIVKILDSNGLLCCHLWMFTEPGSCKGALLWLTVRSFTLGIHPLGDWLPGRNATSPSHCDFRGHFHPSFLTPHDLFSGLSLPARLSCRESSLAGTLVDVGEVKMIVTAFVVMEPIGLELLLTVVAC